MSTCCAIIIIIIVIITILRWIVDLLSLCLAFFFIRTLFRQNLISGERNTFTHIFNYLLSKLDELKQRAYLARFLVKIEVSPDVEGDQDIVQLYEQVLLSLWVFEFAWSILIDFSLSLSFLVWTIDWKF